MTDDEKLKSIALGLEFIAKIIVLVMFFYLFSSIAHDIRDISNSANEIAKSLNIPKELAISGKV